MKFQGKLSKNLCFLEEFSVFGKFPLNLLPLFLGFPEKSLFFSIIWQNTDSLNLFNFSVFSSFFNRFSLKSLVKTSTFSLKVFPRSCITSLMLFSVNLNLVSKDFSILFWESLRFGFKMLASREICDKEFGLKSFLEFFSAKRTIDCLFAGCGVRNEVFLFKKMLFRGGFVGETLISSQTLRNFFEAAVFSLLWSQKLVIEGFGLLFKGIPVVS